MGLPGGVMADPDFGGELLVVETDSSSLTSLRFLFLTRLTPEGTGGPGRVSVGPAASFSLPVTQT